jgi:hypothetical protein
MQHAGKLCRAADGGPPDRVQRNFTDPDSRILPTRDGFIAGYNDQIAVDAAHGVIVSHRLFTSGADVDGLVPLADAAHRALGRKPLEVSADTGFASEANLEAIAKHRIKAYVPPRRERDGRDEPDTTARCLKLQPRMIAMAAMLKRAGHHSRYRLRKQVVEPVFGQISRHEVFVGSSCAASPRSGRVGYALHRPQRPQARRRTL